MKSSKPFLTHQQIFDSAVLHLRSQQKAKLLPTGGGAYRSFGGGGCPVGALIPARFHVTRMEGLPVRYLRAFLKDGKQHSQTLNSGNTVGLKQLRDGLLAAHVNVDDDRTIELLSVLQNVHDIFGTWEWEDRLSQVANQFGLQFNKIQQSPCQSTSPQSTRDTTTVPTV